MLKKQVNKEVDEGYKYLEEEIKKAPGEGSGASPKYPNHSESDNSAWNSTNDDKTESDKDSYQGDDSDTSDKEDESVDADNKSDKDSENDEDQAANFMIRPHDKDPVQTRKEPQLHSLSVTITSTEDVSRYLNDVPEIQITEVMNEALYTESTTMTVTPLPERIQETQKDPAKNVIETPLTTPLTKTKKKRAKKLLQTAIEKNNDRKKVDKQRLDDHEQRLDALSQVNNAEAIKKYIQANVVKEFKNQVPKLLPKAENPSESRSLKQDMEKLHLLRRNDLMMIGNLLKIIGEKKKRIHKDTLESSSKKGKAQDDPTYYERVDDADEQTQEERHGHEVQSDVLSKHNPAWFHKIAEELLEQSWFNELVDVEEELEGHELLSGSVNRFKNSVELEYNLEQTPDRKTIRISYFFNRDLEYLNYGNEEKKYALSVTKIKVARYEQEGIEEMVSYLWSPSIQKYNRHAELGIHHWDDHRQWFYKGNIEHKSRHEVYSKLNIISFQRIKVNKKYGYAYLEEIVVKRTDQKEYMFVEVDFLYLNQNNIEDLYLLKIQKKIHNINDVDEFDLINALQLYIQRIVIKKRVKEVQLRVESYQIKLNLTKPPFMEGCLYQKVSYTTLSHPRGIVYEGTDDRKRLMRVDEIHKFSDGMLNKIYNKLVVILRDHKLVFNNEGMEDRK
ncbi:hypothetical protein Tco_0455184 [Tanacetum coccineum]